ncbi:GlsB/YeaQ/YmgE family stress response membrane protein [Deinococcus sp. Marseille-Q6407]|uniref:GlsB/YeaQ/YmgE family stress response membrane protein n=1 Tax=Deinococcus sp. Marseille-Q6407 TaxID=2969223 RepID=UPI0021C13A14|nr:GlsB/YeaQ/YmgE family stress response membrane protein [Deinococcus sp. Marseille-Q6407]
MSWIITILVGALAGWLASLIMKTDAQQGAIANILIGVVGAALAQWLFGNVFHIGGAQVAGSGFNFWSIVWGVVGSVVLIAILKALRILR